MSSVFTLLKTKSVFRRIKYPNTAHKVPLNFNFVSLCEGGVGGNLKDSVLQRLRKVGNAGAFGVLG